MASNGLVATPTKTALLILNHKPKDDKVSIKVGDVIITQSHSSKLLGVLIEDNQKWRLQVPSLIPALNRKLFLQKRLKMVVTQANLIKIAKIDF